MRAVKMYIAIEDLTYIIRKSVPEEFLNGTEGCSWVPVKIELAPDMTVNITAVAAEND